MKIKLLFILLFATLISFAQNIKKDNLEIYLKDYEETEVNISKGMYMTNNLQYFYEGTLEVVDNDTKSTTMYFFYFSKWDKKFKEFIVKDTKYKYLSPEFTYTKDNKSIKYLDKAGEEVSSVLKDNSTFETAILSSMLVWLENFPTSEN